MFFLFLTAVAVLTLALAAILYSIVEGYQAETLLGSVGHVLSFSLAVMGVIAALALAISLVLWPFIYVGNASSIQEYRAFKDGVEQIEVPNLMDVALRGKMLQWNQWLVSMQIWNETLFDAFIPDKVMELEPIEIR